MNLIHNVSNTIQKIPIPKAAHEKIELYLPKYICRGTKRIYGKGVAYIILWIVEGKISRGNIPPPINSLKIIKINIDPQACSGYQKGMRLKRKTMQKYNPIAITRDSRN